MRLFARPPQLATAGVSAAGGSAAGGGGVDAGVVASSTSGGGASGGSSSGGSGPLGGSGSSGGGSSRPPSGGGYGGSQPPYSGQPRPNRPGVPPGQERVVNYQPEERYWTDYLRIALPIIGLLLMLGLFWYWADAIIGDDDDNDPTATPNVAVTLTQPAETPTPNQAATNITPNVADRQPTETPTDNGGQAPDDTPGTDGAGDGEPTEEGAGSDTERDYEVGQMVTTTDEVNLRTSPEILDDNVAIVLEPGTELEITNIVEEQVDEFFWVEVIDPVSEETGFVAEANLELSE